MLGIFPAAFAISAALQLAENAHRAAEAAKAAGPQADVIDIPPEDVRVIEDVKLIEHREGEVSCA